MKKAVIHICLGLAGLAFAGQQAANASDAKCQWTRDVLHSRWKTGPKHYQSLLDYAEAARANTLQRGTKLYYIQGYTQSLLMYAKLCNDSEVLFDTLKVFETALKASFPTQPDTLDFIEKDAVGKPTHPIDDLEMIQFSFGFFNLVYAWYSHASFANAPVEQKQYFNTVVHRYMTRLAMTNIRIMKSRDRYQPRGYLFMTDRQLQLAGSAVRLLGLQKLIPWHMTFIDDNDLDDLHGMVKYFAMQFNRKAWVYRRADGNGYALAFDRGSFVDYETHLWSGKQTTLPQLTYNPRTKKYNLFQKQSSYAGHDTAHGSRFPNVFFAFEEIARDYPQTASLKLLGDSMPHAADAPGRLTIPQLVTAFANHFSDLAVFSSDKHFAISNFLDGSTHGHYVQNGIIYQPYQHTSVGLMAYMPWKTRDTGRKLAKVARKAVEFLYSENGGEPLCQLVSSSSKRKNDTGGFYRDYQFVGKNLSSKEFNERFCNYYFIRKDITNSRRNEDFPLIDPGKWHTDIRLIPSLLYGLKK